MYSGLDSRLSNLKDDEKKAFDKLLRYNLKELSDHNSKESFLCRDDYEKLEKLELIRKIGHNKYVYYDKLSENYIEEEKLKAKKK